MFLAQLPKPDADLIEGLSPAIAIEQSPGGRNPRSTVGTSTEVLSITQNGQVVRSPINADFRPTGRSTMGVKFVTAKGQDSVAVVTRSVEAKVDEEAEALEDSEAVTEAVTAGESPSAEPVESADDPGDATIETDETS